MADCFCLFLQSSGGGLTASQSSFNIGNFPSPCFCVVLLTNKTGKSIILIGIVAVLCVFVFFLFLVFYVQAAVYKNHKQDIRKWWPIFAAFCILSLLSFFLSSPIFSCRMRTTNSPPILPSPTHPSYSFFSLPLYLELINKTSPWS